MAISKDLRKLVRHLEQQGWTIGYTGGGHLRLKSPAGALVFTSSTPSDFRSHRNLCGQLRRHGAVL